MSTFRMFFLFQIWGLGWIALSCPGLSFAKKGEGKSDDIQKHRGKKATLHKKTGSSSHSLSRDTHPSRVVSSQVFVKKSLSAKGKSEKSADYKRLREKRVRLLLETGLGHFRRNEYKKAIASLSKARLMAPKDITLRYHLARVYLGYAESLQKEKRFNDQRKYYRLALQEDPRLIEDPAFVKRYHKIQTRKAPKGKEPSKAKFPFFKERTYALSLGLTFGIEGLGGLQGGLLLLGRFNPLLTFAPLSETIDFSVRFIFMRTYRWSPYLSLGMLTELSIWTNATANDPKDQFFHAGVGIHFLSQMGFSFALGVSFVYGASQTKRFPLFPTAQLSWYF